MNKGTFDLSPDYVDLIYTMKKKLPPDYTDDLDDDQLKEHFGYVPP